MTDNDLIRAAALRALQEANCTGPFEARVDVMAPHLAVRDGAVVPVNPKTGEPRVRADFLGSGQLLPIPMSELVLECQRNVRGFAWKPVK